MIRTRFAPSPTGYLHIGGARTALFAWAYARRHGGRFVLRIEDTDLERSTEASVNAILDSMKWLGLDWDEGPFFQMQRLQRYREVAEQLISKDRAYWCYASREELERLRDAQRARGDKPRYDGRWRPENVKGLGLTPPPEAKPVVRFRNPDEGEVTFNDLVKGPITVSNSELDDLVILRADGVPTYNFGVVVDDLDMSITHVIRGDDHVNNTPRQVNIFRALEADLPNFAHVPMILGADGERLSKRHGAMSVMQYAEDGYLPEAMLNYLARLGWSHGDAEVFSVQQLIRWFNLEHISRSAAQFNPEKLRWLNHQYIKSAPDSELANLVALRIEKDGGRLSDGPPLASVVALLKDRAETLNDLADAAMLFYGDVHPRPELLSQHVTDTARPALLDLMQGLEALSEWSVDTVNAVVQDVLKRRKIKMPALAVPVRVLVFGVAQTPALSPVLALAGRKRVLSRFHQYLRA
ncbi:MAG: glutamate--tRNA ligase [Betaproteobacteria bacterium RIFCSPLOWO2_02_FULL_65_24]|nr:MAG: glutamate--tRNA ligase [Betaproteobacteria bacterium RIFCSPLOWO2_02_FULL_65_24]